MKFKEYKEKAGIVCPKCGCTTHYWIGGKLQHHRCKNCNYHQSLRSNTVMHYSKLQFRWWFIAFYFVCNSKNSFSAAELQRQIGHKYYRPIFRMMHKIREAMARDNNNTILKGECEVDEAFFSTKVQKELPETTTKGEQYRFKKPYVITKTQAVVMVESETVVNPDRKKYNVTKKCGRLRIQIIPDKKADTITNAVKNKISYDTKVVSDGAASHRDFPDMFKEYIGKKYKTTEELNAALPYVHIIIGNIKALIRNVHHAVEREFIQLYLDEFCWKFNNRFNDHILDDLLLACAR